MKKLTYMLPVLILLIFTLVFETSGAFAIDYSEQLYLKGKLARLNGKLDLAENFLKQSAKMGNRESLLDLYHVEISKNNEIKAIGYLVQAKKYWEVSNEAYLLLANHYLLNEKYDKSLKVLREALPKFPKDPVIIKKLLQLLIFSEKYIETITIASGIIKNFPDDIEMLESLMFAYEKTEEYTKCLKIIEKLRSKRPENPGYKILEGTINFVIGNYKKSFRILKQLSVDHPEMPEVNFNLGILYEYLGKKELARKEYLKYLKSLDGDERKKAIKDLVNIKRQHLKSTRIKE